MNDKVETEYQAALQAKYKLEDEKRMAVSSGAPVEGINARLAVADERVSLKRPETREGDPIGERKDEKPLLIVPEEVLSENAEQQQVFAGRSRRHYREKDISEPVIDHNINGWGNTRAVLLAGIYEGAKDIKDALNNNQAIQEEINSPNITHDQKIIKERTARTINSFLDVVAEDGRNLINNEINRLDDKQLGVLVVKTDDFKKAYEAEHGVPPSQQEMSKFQIETLTVMQKDNKEALTNLNQAQELQMIAAEVAASKSLSQAERIVGEGSMRVGVQSNQHNIALEGNAAVIGINTPQQDNTREYIDTNPGREILRAKLGNQLSSGREYEVAQDEPSSRTVAKINNGNEQSKNAEENDAARDLNSDQKADLVSKTDQFKREYLARTGEQASDSRVLKFQKEALGAVTRQYNDPNAANNEHAAIDEATNNMVAEKAGRNALRQQQSPEQVTEGIGRTALSNAGVDNPTNQDSKVAGKAGEKMAAADTEHREIPLGEEYKFKLPKATPAREEEQTRSSSRIA